MISVILPTYNSEETLKRSVESVINQKGKFKIELIIINDCSQDNTKNYLSKLKNNDKISFIKINNEKNLGVGLCRKMGINIASGEYIAFLDADDYWFANKLAFQLDVLKKNPKYKICFCNYLCEDKNNKFVLVKKRKIITAITNRFINDIPMSTAIVDSNTAKKVDYPSLKIRNDFIFWRNILNLSKNTAAINCDIELPFAVYGMKKGISSNKFRLIFYQWRLYRHYFKYNVWWSSYGILINALKKLFKRKRYYQE